VIVEFSGNVRKLTTQLTDVVQYAMPIGDELIPFNELIGKSISICYAGEINCIVCGRKSKKSFAQGYCYPCFSSLPECDSCIMSPEKCHFKEGTCRDAEWGVAHCMQPHFVYLARSSGIKVGITRGTQIPTRWMDQGAVEALPIIKISQRLYSGQLEVMFKEHISDRTSWQKMLKGEVAEGSLIEKRDELLELCSEQIKTLNSKWASGDCEILTNESSIHIQYPVTEYPTKVKSFNLDKQPVVEGTLMGIKGQYLILDTGVINIRKYSGYHLSFSVN